MQKTIGLLQAQLTDARKAIDATGFTMRQLFPTLAGFYTSGQSNFSMRLPNLASDPAGPNIGSALTVSGGKLKVWSGGAWVIVGTQS